MCNHTGPGGNKSHSQNLRAEKCSDNTDSPHAADTEHKGQHSIAHALHHAFDDDCNAVERLGKRNHSQDNGTQQDYLLVL